MKSGVYVLLIVTPDHRLIGPETFEEYRDIERVIKGLPIERLTKRTGWGRLTPCHSTSVCFTPKGRWIIHLFRGKPGTDPPERGPDDGPVIYGTSEERLHVAGDGARAAKGARVSPAR